MKFFVWIFSVVQKKELTEKTLLWLPNMFKKPQKLLKNFSDFLLREIEEEKNWKQNFLIFQKKYIYNWKIWKILFKKRKIISMKNTKSINLKNETYLFTGNLFKDLKQKGLYRKNIHFIQSPI